MLSNDRLRIVLTDDDLAFISTMQGNKTTLTAGISGHVSRQVYASILGQLEADTSYTQHVVEYQADTAVIGNTTFTQLDDGESWIDEKLATKQVYTDGQLTIILASSMEEETQAKEFGPTQHSSRQQHEFALPGCSIFLTTIIGPGVGYEVEFDILDTSLIEECVTLLVRLLLNTHYISTAEEREAVKVPYSMAKQRAMLRADLRWGRVLSDTQTRYIAYRVETEYLFLYIGADKVWLTDGKNRFDLVGIDVQTTHAGSVLEAIYLGKVVVVSDLPSSLGYYEERRAEAAKIVDALYGRLAVPLELESATHISDEYHLFDELALLYKLEGAIVLIPNQLRYSQLSTEYSTLSWMRSGTPVVVEVRKKGASYVLYSAEEEKLAVKPESMSESYFPRLAEFVCKKDRLVFVKFRDDRYHADTMAVVVAALEAARDPITTRDIYEVGLAMSYHDRCKDWLLSLVPKTVPPEHVMRLFSTEDARPAIPTDTTHVLLFVLDGDSVEAFFQSSLHGEHIRNQLSIGMYSTVSIENERIHLSIYTMQSILTETTGHFNVHDFVSRLVGEGWKLVVLRRAEEERLLPSGASAFSSMYTYGLLVRND
jgi:hypothetical protein